MISDLKNRQQFFLEMARTLLYWLNYIKNTCKEDILKEELIRIPLAEFIERKLAGSIGLEVQMDELNTDKHHDFAYKVKYNNRIVRGCVEAKYVQGLTRKIEEQQRYFNDICRLAQNNKNGTDNLLIVFGPNYLFKTNLRRLVDGRKKEYGNGDKELPPAGIYSKWLPFEVNETKTFSLNEFPDHYKSFRTKYKGIRLNKIKTELLALLKDESDYNTFVVGIWKVTRTK